MNGAFVVGAGPGLGASVALRFGRTGMPIGLIARSRSSVDTVKTALASAGIESVGVTADAADEAEIKAGLDALVQEIGVPAVLVYNAALIRADRPGELRYAEHQSAYAINVLGAITSATHLAPQMAKTGGGTILITGGMPAPDPTYTSLSLGKACGRALTHLLADEYGASGIHIATVIVSAEIAPGGPFSADLIAEEYWRLHTQTPDEWELEVVFAGVPASDS